MTQSPKLTIRKNFDRTPAALLDAFSNAPTGWVVDALGRRGALPHVIRPISDNCRFIGTALTVRTRPVDNLAPYAALKFAEKGDVLVIATDNSDSASVLGDILLGMARNAGIVAVVTDGLVRDIAGINEVGLPTFARAISPNSPHKDGPGEIGIPVSIGGEVINPGDIILGDRDGVVVVPRQAAEAAAANLRDIADKEAGMEQAVADGASFPGWLEDYLASDQVRYVD